MNRNQQKKMLIIQSMANKEQNRPFRFYDNRQKYLTFVNTCCRTRNGRTKFLQPKPPALRFFDAGMGDASVLSHVLRAAHRQYPTIPFYIVDKEISLEDLRLSLYKFPDRLVEHPASVIIVSNLFYSEATTLSPHRSKKSINRHEIALKGSSSHGFNEQLRAIDELLVDGWQGKSKRSKRQSVICKTIRAGYLSRRPQIYFKCRYSQTQRSHRQLRLDYRLATVACSFTGVIQSR